VGGGCYPAGTTERGRQVSVIVIVLCFVLAAIVTKWILEWAEL
jgi:hypothetical protein